MSEIIILTGAGFLLGFVSCECTRFLDAAMNIGHILDFKRINAVRKAAEKIGKLDWFNKEFEKLIHIVDFGDRIAETDKLYWVIATQYKPLVKWLCPFCMSHRIALAINVTFIASYWILFGFNWTLIPTYFIAFSVNQYLISK
jgi:hypothetical protein